MMPPTSNQQFEEIDRFLMGIGYLHLFDYLSLNVNADEESVSVAVKKKRAWAQGQQSNPKYRDEAKWLIKSTRTITSVLTQQRAPYVASIEAKRAQIQLQDMRTFILGTLASGPLTRDGEQAILSYGEDAGLGPEIVRQQIDDLLVQQGVQRQGDNTAPFSDLEDWYAVLEVSPTAELSGIEAAYRARYRTAGMMKDKDKANALYAQLDQAWRVLKDDQTRAEYDTVRQSQAQASNDPLAPSGPTDTWIDDEPPKPAPSESAAPKQPTLDLEPLLEAAEPGSNPAMPRTEPPPRTPVLRSPEPTPASTLQPPDTAPQTTHFDSEADQPPPRATPRLHVEGHTSYNLQLNSAPETISLMIRNIGSGSMPGKLTTDRSWLTITPNRLKPNAKSQTIRIAIDKERFPKEHDVAQVALYTRHGESWHSSISIQRTMVRKTVLGAAFLLLAVGTAFSWYLTKPPGPGIQTARLMVNTNPPSGEIYVDDTLLSSNGELDITEDFPIDQPFEVRVELDGFANWQQTVTATKGSTTPVKADLEMIDPMNFIPTSELLRADVNSNQAEQTLSERTFWTDRCFTEFLVGEPGFIARLEVTAYVSPRGYVVGLETHDSNFTSPEVLNCLKRQLRAIRLPLVPGDYGQFRHIFQYAYSLPSTE